MGRYISINCKFEGPHLTSKVLEPAFSSSFFKPIALSGLCSAREGRHWFLSGYAVENFISSYTSTSLKVASIELASSAMSPEYEYLLNQKENIARLRPPMPVQSPFEQLYLDNSDKKTSTDSASPSQEEIVQYLLAEHQGLHSTVANERARGSRYVRADKDAETGVTFVPQVHLDRTVLEQCDQWLHHFSCPHGSLHLFGTVDLAVQNPGHLPWRESYRFLFPAEVRQGRGSMGPVFLFISAQTTPVLEGVIEVSIYSQTEVWLEKAGALNNRIAASEADRNLANLVALTQLMAQNPLANLESMEIHIDGKPFIKEQKRLQDAFDSLNVPVQVW